jgi:hypothetical protein
MSERVADPESHRSPTHGGGGCAPHAPVSACADVFGVADHHLIPKYLFAAGGRAANADWYVGFADNAITFGFTALWVRADHLFPPHSDLSKASNRLESARSQLLLSKHDLDVIAVGIEDKSSIVTRRVAARSQAGGTVIYPASLDRCRMKIIDLLAAYRPKGGMLSGVVRMEDVDPEHRVVDAVCHPAQIGTVGVGGFEVPRDTLNDPNTKRSERCLIECI